MRVWLLPVTAVFAFTLGCNKSPEGGTTPGNTAGFKLSLPVGTKDVKQGTTQTYDASIDRDSGFKHDVKLSVGPTEKIEVKLSKDVIKASDDTKFTITVTPAKDAALGDHSIKITATPEGGGNATSQDFKIKVTENK